MIDELRFRAFDNRNQRWTDSCFETDIDEYIVGNTVSQILVNTKYNNKSHSSGFLYTIQLAANMLDINGVEIFQGDILEHTRTDGTKLLFKIWLVSGGLVMNSHQEDFYRNEEHIITYDAIADKQTASFISSCLVVGNIIDNPELLKL